ncbi:TVP38/TMEM64 family protein [Halogeometricum borinquense]|uniref:TVP38/TMEM64 family protein n=1 Tax=Halogeometricum borinquense TaxID=60847 RepID=A0A6C0UMS1_9EURY|nr:VTT domain-containing protein [Halogeometricum borinquense]QIB75179.1 TVP38/TMEM64 family protein [Halogeometricum borinquense]QIQ75840.1 TVP38/TMEM64 family protein [Halogeometricum borinquense]
MDRLRIDSRAAVGLLLFVVAAAAVLLSPEAVLSRAAWVAADPVRLVAATVALAIVRPLLAWPTTLLALVVGFGFGFAGLPFALTLIVLTSVPPYLFARRYGRTGRLAAAGESFVERTGDLRSVVLSRLVPAPSDVVSVGAGIAGVRLRWFVVGTAIGETPWAVAGVLAGTSAESLATGALAGAIDGRLVVAAALAAVLLFAPTAYEWYDERADGSDSDAV